MFISLVVNVLWFSLDCVVFRGKGKMCNKGTGDHFVLEKRLQRLCYAIFLPPKLAPRQNPPKSIQHIYTKSHLHHLLTPVVLMTSPLLKMNTRVYSVAQLP